MTLTPNIALQLYSIRRELEYDFAGSMARVREIGFESVELYNIVAWKEDIARELTANGIAATTAHARLTEGNQDAILSAAAELGVQTIIDPFVAKERWTTKSDVEAVADELAEAAANASAYGLEFAYHNHAWEVENTVDGKTALEYLSARLPRNAALEVDTYWAAIAGADVTALLRTLGNRVRFLHLKDAPLGADGLLSTDRMDQLPVGEGIIDWAGILAAAPHAEVYVVEFDEFLGDVISAAGRSLTTLSGWIANA
ncbi:sugar phosphate isomerase/epimerase family protein [Microbacterium sp. GXF0217]